MQQPHPPLWSTTNSKNQAHLLGEKGYVIATLGSGYGTRPLYDAYRQGYYKTHRQTPGADRFAYLGLVACANDETEARRRGDLVAGYLRTSAIVHIPYRNPPGYLSIEDNARILKAMSHRGEPFNWEGEHFHYRQFNIWPRPVQQPHPPLWSTTNSKNNAYVLGEKGYVIATLGSGYGTRPLYDAYRQGYYKTHRKAPGADRFAYLGLVAVANDEAEARRRGDQVADYLRTSAIVHLPYRNPPGYLSVEDNARILKGFSQPRGTAKDGRPVDIYRCPVQDLIDAGILFCGTPDQVYNQIVEFCEYCGGMGNLLMMGQAGYLNHEDTADNLTLFAKEVLPRLQQWKQPVAEVATA